MIVEVMMVIKPTADKVKVMDHFRPTEKFLGCRGSRRPAQVT